SGVARWRARSTVLAWPRRPANHLDPCQVGSKGAVARLDEARSPLRLLRNSPACRTAVSSFAVRLGPGSKVGPYEVMATLGTGGMAEVYRAKDSRLQREVALKVVAEAFGSDGAFLARLEHEARLAGSLNHPNVVAVYDVGSHEGAPYVVSELLQGE